MRRRYHRKAEGDFRKRRHLDPRGGTSLSRRLSHVAVDDLNPTSARLQTLVIDTTPLPLYTCAAFSSMAVSVDDAPCGRKPPPMRRWSWEKPPDAARRYHPSRS